jgi:hypothetical protein
MDRMKQYDRTVHELVEQYAAEWKPHDGTSIEVVTDSEHGHYQIVRSGWKDGRFIHSCLVHFTVRGQKVQLLRNDTDVEWDRELIDRGVAPDDIVLAFRQVVGQRGTSATAYPDTDNVTASSPATPVLKS